MKPEPVPLYRLLTGREYEVLERIAAGHANKEIAHELGIALHTVEQHVSRLYRKLNVRNRVEATNRFKNGI